MKGINDLPNLAIVPVENLVLHEHHDEQRVPPLIENLHTNGVLRNPPVVIPLNEQPATFMVLDGANRVSAFRMSGIPHILVQILPIDDGRVELDAWNHVVWGVSSDNLFGAIRTIPGVILRPSTALLSFRDLMDLHSLVSIHLPDGKVFTAFISTIDLIERVRALNTVVARYIEFARIDRTSIYQVEALAGIYENFAGLVLLPAFQVREVIDVVEAGHLMPPGSTRFTISPRALHLNYPLSKLDSDISIDQKNADLREYLSICLAQKRVRYYAEPTYLFDE